MRSLCALQLLRRTVLVILVTFVSITGGWRFPALALFLFALLVVQFGAEPFAALRDNRAETISLCILMVVRALSPCLIASACCLMSRS